MSIFRIEREGEIALLVFDVPGAPVNTLNKDARAEFERLLPELAADASVKAVVLISGKPENFIAGADIEEFTKLTTAAEAAALSRTGQERLELGARGLVERVDRGARDIEHQEGDVAVTFDAEDAHQARSRIIAIPIPPCAQIEISPNCTLRRVISLASWVTRRAPVAPNG